MQGREWHPYQLNALAKEIRELFPVYDPATDTANPDKEQSWYTDTKRDNMAKRGTLCALALSLAHRIKDDMSEFDYLKWLDQCSPDPERFPISELWED